MWVMGGGALWYRLGEGRVRRRMGKLEGGGS